MVAGCVVNLGDDANATVSANRTGSNPCVSVTAPLAAEESWAVAASGTGYEAEAAEQQHHSGACFAAAMDVEQHWHGHHHHQQQQLQDVSWAVGDAGMCSAAQFVTCGRPLMVRPPPSGQLQLKWAAHMQAVAGAEADAGLPGLNPAAVTATCNCLTESNTRAVSLTGIGGAGGASLSAAVASALPGSADGQTSRQCHGHSIAAGRCVQQRQQQPQPGLQHLQQLLTANTSLPSGQLASLRQLDLSLEQLHELQGLDQLCPQLMVG